jgi:hypothetical protein
MLAFDVLAFVADLNCVNLKCSICFIQKTMRLQNMLLFTRIPNPYLPAFAVRLPYVLTFCISKRHSYVTSCASCVGCWFSQGGNYCINLYIRSGIALGNRARTLRNFCSFWILYVFKGISSHPLIKAIYPC